MTAPSRGGLIWPIRARYLSARLSRHVLTSAIVPGTHKWVFMLYQAMLIGYFVARFLFTDILDYCSLIHTCRTDKIAFAPEMTIPKPMLKIRELLEYHQTAFSFQVAHDLGNTILGRNFDIHMLYDQHTYSLSISQSVYIRTIFVKSNQSLSVLPINNITPELWSTYGIIFAIPKSML